MSLHLSPQHVDQFSAPPLLAWLMSVRRHVPAGTDTRTHMHAHARTHTRHVCAHSVMQRAASPSRHLTTKAQWCEAGAPSDNMQATPTDKPGAGTRGNPSNKLRHRALLYMYKTCITIRGCALCSHRTFRTPRARRTQHHGPTRRTTTHGTPRAACHRHDVTGVHADLQCCSSVICMTAYCCGHVPCVLSVDMAEVAQGSLACGAHMLC